MTLAKVTTTYLLRLGGMNDMENIIYSAEFARKLCDDYNSLTNTINRYIKEAVNTGRYQTDFVVTKACSDYDKLVECLNQFEDLGYCISIRNENLFNNDSVRISISWE